MYLTDAAEPRLRAWTCAPAARSGTTSGRCRRRCRSAAVRRTAGFAALGDRVFMGTLDAHVVALDAKTGRVRWDVAAAEADKGYSFTGAPLVGQGQGHRRRRRRRVRHPRLHRRLRRGDGQARVALLHDSGRRRARQRHLGGRLVEARRRAGLGHRLVRSGAEHALLGHRQPGTADVRRQSRSATTSTPIRWSRSIPTPAR